MIILGNRILISKVEEEKKDGFQTVEVQDSFLYKGKVEQIGNGFSISEGPIKEGDTILFAKYSPSTQSIQHEGKDYKVISVDDVIAVL